MLRLEDAKFQGSVLATRKPVVGDLAITVEAFNPTNIGSIVRVLHKHQNQSALICSPTLA